MSPVALDFLRKRQMAQARHRKQHEPPPAAVQMLADRRSRQPAQPSGEVAQRTAARQHQQHQQHQQQQPQQPQQPQQQLARKTRPEQEGGAAEQGSVAFVPEEADL